MRLFISVDLDGLDEEVRRVQEPFRLPGLNPVDPTQAHITLKFLGDVASARVDEVCKALEVAVATAAVDPFSAHFGGYGVFPSLDYISVVWLGVRQGEGDTELTLLHDAIEDQFTELGFDPGDHSFTPHVTLARMDDARSKDAVRTIVQERDPDAGRLDVNEIRLIESTLTANGPEYRTVEAVQL